MKLLLILPMVFQTAIAEPVGNSVKINYKDEVYSAALPQDLPDFSYAGYKGGGVALPAVPVVKRIDPSGADDTKAIQAAVDSVAKLPIQADGFRGTLLFTPGTFKVSGTINIKASGIVLGGFGADKTIIYSTSTNNDTVLINIVGNENIREVSGTRTDITASGDVVVAHNNPVITVKDVAKYKVGDSVIVYKNTNDAWIKLLKADQREVPWTASYYRTKFERTVVAISGNKVTLNTNVPEDIYKQYGGAQLYKYTSSRLNNIGIENMALASTYVKGKENSDENHARTGVEFNGAENGWVKNIIAYHFWANAVHISNDSRFITVQDSSMLDPVSQITGGRRYPFSVDGQNNLVFRCYARNGRHDFATGSKVLGPNVFLYSKSDLSHADAGPHHRWTVGTLYDNVETINLSVQDRMDMGSGHGWAGAYHVLWNNKVSNAMICQVPPMASNWLIGGVYKRNVGAFKPRPQCTEIIPGRVPAPQSLYLYQLNKRLGPSAVANLLGVVVPTAAPTATVVPTAMPGTESVIVYAVAPGQTGQWWCTNHFGKNLGGQWNCVGTSFGTCSTDAAMNEVISCRKVDNPAPTATPSVGAHKSNLTWYTSYPDPKSEECIKYNGCKWAGQFAALDNKMPESWVKANNIIAVHEKDFPKYKLKTLRLTQGTKSIDAKVYDMCSDSDCSGCCTKNSKATGFLIDIESYTKARFGSGDGVVDWTCLDCQ